ncbi:MAG TPA: hypothetical protein VNX26_02620 [Candidatus Acidoferrum sp.]|jgi:hypothetical protein|nr:hypothetical protein [Candidatus Acidoferrum sp.]
MSIEIASFVFGGILLFVGVLGGGFELKELKVPKVGTGVRVLAALLGLVFITAGFGSRSDSSPKPADNNDHNLVHAAVLPEEPVEFTLVDDLGQGEVSEQVTVLMDGKDLGNLTVNQDYPHSKLRVTVPHPGQHSYTIEATTIFAGPQGQFRYDGAGQGMIDVQRGKTYSLRGSITGNTLFVSLEQEP